MINRKEELAEYIIKNIVFISLFVVFCFYAISYILLPKIQDFRNMQNGFRQQQFLESKIKETNKDQQSHIKTKKQENDASLLALQSNIHSAKFQTIAQEFFEVHQVTDGDKVDKELFQETTFSIQGKSNGTKAIFDFIQKINQEFPNVIFSLPFELSKIDPLNNTLNVHLTFKITTLHPRNFKKS